MSRKTRIAAIGVVVAITGLSGARGQRPGGGQYQSAAVRTAAGDIAYPPNARTPGMVTLDVSVGANGTVQNVITARDVPPLTEAAKQAVSGWNFSSAKKGEQDMDGVARVNVVFNPFNPSDVSIPNKPLPQQDNAGAQSTAVFRPADVKTAGYATYPANTLASGSVVLDVKVGADGSVAGVRVLRGTGVLADAATRATKDWAFTAAMYQGKAVESRVTVAFVFVKPEIGTM